MLATGLDIWLSQRMGGAGWVLTAGGVKASLDVDFVNDRIYGGSTINNFFTCSRATGGYYTNANGTLTWVGANTNRYGTNGLLVEEQRTNLCLQSETYSSASWSKNNLTNVTNTTAGPDGSSTSGVLLNETVAASEHNVSQNFVKAASATTYTLSAYAKVGVGRTRLTLVAYSNTEAGTGTYAPFDLSGGQKGTLSNRGAGWAGSTSTITALANGWYRCTLTFTTGIGTDLTIQIADDSGSGTSTQSTNYAGTVGNGVYIFGVQLEAASFASSYFPTTTIAAARSADLITFTNTSWISTGPQTYFGIASCAGTALSTLVHVNGGSGANERACYKNSNQTFRAQSTVGGVTDGDAQTAGTVFSTNAFAKWAAAFDTNDLAVVLNASTAATDNTLVAQTTLNSANLGSYVGGSIFLNGYIARFAVWNSRVSNANMQTLTTYTLAESVFSLDFVNNNAFTRSYLGQATTTASTPSSLLTCTRATGGYYTSSTGTLTWVAANTLRNGDQGLLVEQSSTNLVLQSQTFANASWTKNSNSVTMSDGAVSAPDATLTGSSYIGDNTLNLHQVLQTIAKAAASTQYAFSIYAKAGSLPNCLIQMNDAGGGCYAVINLSDGTTTTAITTYGAGWTAGSITATALANSWYRLTLVATSGANASFTPSFRMRTAGNSDSWAGDGATAQGYFWGAQVEALAFATSYFPTTTIAAARSTDQVDVTDVSFLSIPGGIPGSFYAAHSAVAYAVGPVVIGHYSASTNSLYIETTGVAKHWNNSTTVATANSVAVNLARRAMVAFDSSNRSIVLNGGTVATAATGPGIVDRMRLGAPANSVATQVLNGYITRVAFIPTKVGDTNIQTLTT